MIIINAIAFICLFSGLIFFIGGTVGILRFPDFYTRLHAAGKLDTLGGLAMLLGLVILSLDHISLNSMLTDLKILMCMVFVFLASPTSTHAIVYAGMEAGLEPWTKAGNNSGKKD